MTGACMETTKEALKLFIQSLPIGCKFHIISFGTSFSYLDDQREPFDYDEETSDRARSMIDSFKADLGGTEILKPLSHIFAADLKQRYKKRIFLLTDGEVQNSIQVMQEIKNNCQDNDQNKVFTFGIGNTADRNLVMGAAIAGKGDFSIVHSD